MKKSITLSIISISLFSTILLANSNSPHHVIQSSDQNFTPGDTTLTDSLNVPVEPHITACKCIDQFYDISDLNLINSIPISDQSIVIQPELIISDDINFGAKVHPNPTANRTTLKFEVDTSDNFIIQIFDLSGKLLEDVFSGHLDKGRQNFKIDLSEYQTGLYFISIQSSLQNETLKIEKI